MKKTFRKEEKLRSRSTIERLFQRGNPAVQTFYHFPFRVLFIPAQAPDGASETPIASQSAPPQVLFSVSKRNFKRAVDRNLIRRRCREAYRLHKHVFTLESEAPPAASVAFLYLAKEISPYDVIEKSMVKILQKMAAPPSS
ncbi:ribonuclease P protein component [Persicitalea jodogahamensis]|uniref:ribonuclease P protein component n=1 Tax=Persicitalea jodogahamensis TaxID=402147 RepID=UPI0016780B6D|nr:ribonuclease P protein component [Persicitalea jodogahamensis]